MADGTVGIMDTGGAQKVDETLQDKVHPRPVLRGDNSRISTGGRDFGAKCFVDSALPRDLALVSIQRLDARAPDDRRQVPGVRIGQHVGSQVQLDRAGSAVNIRPMCSGWPTGWVVGRQSKIRVSGDRVVLG